MNTARLAAFRPNNHSSVFLAALKVWIDGGPDPFPDLKANTDEPVDACQLRSEHILKVSVVR